MTTLQIQLIRDTFALVTPHAEATGLGFYRRLFERDPRLRPLFRPDLREQAALLMQMLTAAVRLLDKPEALQIALEGLGRRHAGYGVKDEHYDTVGAALLETLSDGLGAHFTDRAREAWSDFYHVVASTMRSAAQSSFAS